MTGPRTSVAVQSHSRRIGFEIVSRPIGAVRGVREAGVVAHVVDRQFALTPGGEKVCDVRFGERMIAVPMLPPPGMVDGVLDIYDNQSA